VNTLLYTMGDKANDILKSFGLSEADKQKDDSVKGKFVSHFVKRRSIIYERAKFQHEGTGREGTCGHLQYALAERCEYGLLHNEMIRDRLTRCSSIGKTANLTLDKAISTVHKSEAVN
jgi:hypothetical protein